MQKSMSLQKNLLITILAKNAQGAGPGVHIHMYPYGSIDIGTIVHIGISIGTNLSLVSVKISVTVWYQYGTNIPILITDTWLFASISVWYLNQVTYQNWY